MRRMVVAIAAMAACSGRDPAPPEPAPARAPQVAVKPAKPAIVAPGRRLPEGATPLAYDLRLELDPDVDGFSGTVKIRVKLDRATDHVWLHADDLAISAASWDEGPLARLEVTGDRMVGYSFGHVVQPRTVTLAFAFTGHTSHDQEGLFRQQREKRWYLFSQGESEFARRFVPCFDEPRWKTPWRVTLVVPKADIGVANSPLEHETTLADGRHELVFAETPPMPSYLVAIAAGPFAVVDAGVAGQAKVPVRVIAPAGAQVGVVAARTPAIVAALEAYTGDALPLAKLDFVVVPRFFGAMENPGLITFEEEAIVGEPRLIAGEFVRIAAHELAHQWFGDLVTPAWWDDLWLSEAFASWLGDRVAAQLGFFGHLELRRVMTRAHALEADNDAGAQPLHRTTTFDPEDEFDAISYDKGESVLTTFESWIGADKFRAGLRAYLGAHRGGTVTTDDLVRALGEATSPEAAAALHAYVDHAGPPVLELGLTCDGAPKLTGHARDGLRIPACVRYATAQGSERACGLFADRTELPLASCPAWAYPDDLGYYQIVWTSHGPRGPLPPLDKLAAPNKLVMASDLAAAVARGDVATRDALAELTSLASSRDIYGEYAAILVARAIDRAVDDPTRPAWQAWLAKRFARRIGPEAAFQPPRGFGLEHPGAILAMVTADHLPPATVTRARGMLDAALARRKVVDPLVVLAAGDYRAAFDKLVTLARETKDPDTRSAAVDDLGWFATPQIDGVVALAGKLPRGQTWQAMAPFFERGATRTAAWAALRAHLPEMLADLSESRVGDVMDTMGLLCDGSARAEVAKLFDPQVGRVSGGRGRLDHALAAIDRCIERRTRSGDLAAALQ